MSKHNAKASDDYDDDDEGLGGRNRRRHETGNDDSIGGGGGDRDSPCPPLAKRHCANGGGIGANEHEHNHEHDHEHCDGGKDEKSEGSLDGVVNCSILLPGAIRSVAASCASASPYPHGLVPAPFCDRTFLMSVLDEIKSNSTVKFKESDLFRMYQSIDLANLIPDSDYAARMPRVMALRAALYSAEFRCVMEDWTGLPRGTLIDRIDCAANCHVRGCHLLCHDDVIGTRKVSYILYLTDPNVDWTDEDGGRLELYDSYPEGEERTGADVETDADAGAGAGELQEKAGDGVDDRNAGANGGHKKIVDGMELGDEDDEKAKYTTKSKTKPESPHCPISASRSKTITRSRRRVPHPIPTKAILPTFNSLAFFVVRPGVSFHSVQEVFAEDKPRLSLQGWFHARDVPDDIADATLNRLKSRTQGEGGQRVDGHGHKSEKDGDSTVVKQSDDSEIDMSTGTKGEDTEGPFERFKPTESEDAKEGEGKLDEDGEEKGDDTEDKMQQQRRNTKEEKEKHKKDKNGKAAENNRDLRELDPEASNAAAGTADDSQPDDSSSSSASSSASPPPLSASDINYLSRYINPLYLQPLSMCEIRSRFVDESSVRLRHFLTNDWSKDMKTSITYEDDEVDRLGRGKPSLDYTVGIGRKGALVMKIASKSRKRVVKAAAGGEETDGGKAEDAEDEENEGGCWTVTGPAHKQRFLEYVNKKRSDSGDGGSEEGVGGTSSSTTSKAGPLLSALRSELLTSAPFARYLNRLTSLATPSGYRGPIRRFRPGLDYTVAHYGVLTQTSVLDGTLCFCSGSGDQPAYDLDVGDVLGTDDDAVWEAGDAGGFECYISAEDDDDRDENMVKDKRAKGGGEGGGEGGGGKGDKISEDAVDAERSNASNHAAETYDENDDTELLSVAASHNTLSLVLRDPGTMRFVKYVGSTAPGSRWDVAMEYEIPEEEEEEERRRDTEENEEVGGGGLTSTLGIPNEE